MLTHIGEFEHGRGQHQHHHWTALDWGKFPVSVLSQPSALSKTLSRIHTFCLRSEDTPIWICESKLLTQSYLRHTFSSMKWHWEWNCAWFWSWLMNLWLIISQILYTKSLPFPTEELNLFGQEQLFPLSYHQKTEMLLSRATKSPHTKKSCCKK